MNPSFLADYQAVPVGVTDMSENPQGGTVVSPTSPVWQHSRRAQSVSVFPSVGKKSFLENRKAAKYPSDEKLYKAAVGGKFNEVKILLESCDVNSVDFTTGGSALHGAVESEF